MVLDDLARGFDRTVLMDLLNTNDYIMTKTKSVVIFLLVIYLLISVLLQGGWLYNIRKSRHSIKTMLSQGLKHFGPFLSISVFSIFLIVAVGGIIALSFTKIVGDPLVTFSSEKPYVIWIVALFIIFILWSITIWSWSVITRCHFIDGNSFLASLKLGIQTFKNHWLKFLAIGILIVGIHVVFMISYYWIMGDRGAPSWLIVIIGILIPQVFNYLRVMLRGFGYSLVENLI
jgi:hypothetical protein